jgi:hypothetical protein
MVAIGTRILFAVAATCVATAAIMAMPQPDRLEANVPKDWHIGWKGKYIAAGPEIKAELLAEGPNHETLRIQLGQTPVPKSLLAADKETASWVGKGVITRTNFHDPFGTVTAAYISKLDEERTMITALARQKSGWYLYYSYQQKRSMKPDDVQRVLKLFKTVKLPR